MEGLEQTRRSKEQELFVHWHDDIRTTVRRAVLRRLASPAEADEVTQEVMLELWSKADRVSWADGCPHGWAATIAKRRAIDRVRSDRSRVEREERTDRSTDPVISLVSEDVIVLLEQERLVDALEVLSPDQREAIVLAFFGGFSYTEVARVLGLPEGTVKRRIRDGLTLLRAKLSDLR